MKRRLLFPILFVMLIASSVTPFLFTAQASSGCGAVGGLSGFLGETLSRSTGNVALSAGETITVKVTAPSPSGFTDVQLTVGGFSQTSSSPISYTIPSDGNYNVTVTDVALEDLNFVSVSCAAASSSDSKAGPPWSGFTDGRLNPDMAENYSLWCLRNNLDIYRAPNGVGEFIISVPLSKILSISVGKSLAVVTKTGPIIIERASADLVFVKGNNGTNRPAFTQKFFTITDCIVKNGPLPPTRTPVPPTRTPVPPTSTPTRTPVPPTPTAVPTAAGTPFIQSGSSMGNLVTLLVALGPTDPSKDTDGDGIRNTLDLCPTVSAPGLAFGCPDDDGDGLSNPVDQCPQVAGPMSGCPDTDGDGVSDRNDLCPNFVPPADKPKVYGCLDSDGDGFPNGFYAGTKIPMDWCPLNAGIAGQPMFMGCPDPDGDGFLDTSFRLVPDAFVDDCPRYPLPWNPADGACPDTTSLAPAAPNPTVALFLYASQVGAYDNLYVPTQAEETQVCSAARYLFCFS